MNEEKVQVAGVDTMPVVDPYHRDTGQLSAVAFWLDPQKRRCGIDQDYDTGGMDAKVYHGIQYNIRLDERPDQDEAKGYLEGEVGQALLREICDGHTVSWDGHNMVGTLTEDAEEYLMVLVDALNSLKESEWTNWEADEWLSMVEGPEVTATTTDDEIDQMVQEMTAQALAGQVILEGTRSYLEQLREEAA